MNSSLKNITAEQLLERLPDFVGNTLIVSDIKRRTELFTGMMNTARELCVEEQAYNLALTADENSQTVSTDIVVEGVNYGKITATLSVGSGEAPSLPDKSAAYDIYSEDADFPSDYVEQEKMVEFAKEVLMNVGLDEATANELAVEFGDSIYYTYDAWEDDYGWDNEEFDFDEEYYDWDSEEFSDDMDIYWDEDFDIDMDDVEIPEINLDDIELS